MEQPKVDLTQGAKADTGKVRYDLVSPAFIHGTAEILTFGATKYAPYNWAKGILFSRVYGALQRHLTAWQAGEENDEETGMSHLWHASCCLMFLVHYTFPPYKRQYGPYDDRPNYADSAQSPSGTGNAKEELSGTRGFGGKDSGPVVTPDSRHADRVQSDDAHRSSPPGPAWFWRY